MELTRRLEFCAAHRLSVDGLSEAENAELFGPCARDHGHNWAVEVTVRGPVDARTGMVLDLAVLARLLDERVFAPLDHRHLNHDVPWLEGRNPTTEALALGIWEQLEDALAGRLHRVRVYESRHSWADCLGPG